MSSSYRFARGAALFLAVATMSAQGAHAQAAKSLSIGVSQEPDTLHPIITTMTVSNGIRSMVSHPLAAVNEVWKWECWLCTRVPSIENGDAKVVEEGGKKKLEVRWEIRQDAVWGDGTPVTGHDMKLAWEIGVAPTVTKGSPDAFDGIESITVDAQNPKRFTFKYKEVRYDYNQINYQTFVPIPSKIEGPIWERTKDQTGAYEKQTAYVTDPTNPGLYNGPYKVREIKPASHVLLELNPRFAGQAAQFPTILFKVIPNTQTLEANLISGSIDMTGGVGITFDQALSFRKRLGTDRALGQKFRVASMDDLIFEHIDFNLRDERMADVNVRRALMHSVDRARLTQALFDGLQKPAASAYHPMSPYFTEDVPTYAYDTKKAEELLEAAGWKKGADGIRAKDGKKLTFTIMSTSQNKVRELVQVHLQEAWRKIGVELSIKNQPARVFFGGTLRFAEYGEMGMYASTLASPDSIQIESFHSSKIPTKENGHAGSNYMAWKNEKVDRLLEQAQVELDPAKRAALIKEVIKEYKTDLPQMPLYYRVAVLIAPTALKTNQLGGVDYPFALKVNHWTWEPGAASH